MAPQLTEDEIDDLIYFARVGENVELTETITALADREKVSPAEVLVAAKDEGKSTTLHMASGNGNIDMVRTLLQYLDSRPKDEKQAFLDEPNEHGNTALHWAALGGHLETVKLLLDHDASPALANERNYVPLDLANFNDKTEVTQYFLSFAECLQPRDEQMGGLAVAAEGVDLDGADDKEDENPQGAS